MRPLRIIPSCAILLFLVLTACAPKTGAPQSAPVEPAAATALPTAEIAAATVPGAVAQTRPAPVMEVGSTFLYVDGARLKAVPQGPFTMGRPGGTDNPETLVTLPDYWIYETEVNNQQYKWCVELGGCTPPNLDDNPAYEDLLRQNDPVVGVTWEQGQAYCAFVSARYPTEAEWEKAARGPDGYKYPWGNDAPNAKLLNYKGNVGRTTPVTDYREGKSYYDALNLAGNTWEWVADWYEDLYYRQGTAESPVGPDAGRVRSIRSTGYAAKEDQVAAFVRFYARPEEHRRDLGFRCAVDDPTFFAPFCQMSVHYGSTDGGSTTADCGPAQILDFGDCGPNDTSIVNVHVESPSGTTVTGITVEGGVCNPPFPNPPDGAVHVCTPGTTITITQECDAPPDTGGEPGCPSDGYELGEDGISCIPIGGPGSCLPGFTYDPTLMCCQGGTPICATGFTSYAGTCVPDETGLHDLPDESVTTSVPTGQCTPDDGGGPDCEEHPDDPQCQDGGCNPQTDPNCRPDGGCPPQYPNCNPTTGCLAAGTMIDTPSGPQPVETLIAGDVVWTLDAQGDRIAAPISRVARTPVTPSHQMVRLVLGDGRELLASLDHPAADGRPLGALQPGDEFDGSVVIVADVLAYGLPATYDLLPAGDAGYYWADGILLGSTLSER